VTIFRLIRRAVPAVMSIGADPMDKPVPRVIIRSIFAMLASVAVAAATPTFSKSFSPSTIGVDNISKLTYTITNSDGTVATDMAFSETLPSEISVATAPAVQSDCRDAVVSAAQGGSTVDFSGAQLGTGESCSITLYVTSSTEGTYTATSGTLSSSAGNSGTSSASLVVTTTRPGFSKSFAPASIPVGQVSTLTYTINHTVASVITSVAFSDSLPVGLQVAPYPNATTTCTGATLSATAGGSTVSLVGGFFTAAGSCTASVDVVGLAKGTQQSISAALTSSAGTSGLAYAKLDVTYEALRKVFITNPVAPGEVTAVQYTLNNFSRSDAATAVSFTDDFDSALSGMVASAPTSNSCGGSVSGSSVLSVSGIALASESSCTITVPLSVPASAAVGDYVSTATNVSATVGGVSESWADASDTLRVRIVPKLTMRFIESSVKPGETATLELNISNPSASLGLSAIEFTDPLGTFLSGVSVASGTGSNVCGSGSFLFTQEISGIVSLVLSGGSLAAGGSCSMQVGLLIPEGTTAGGYLNSIALTTSTYNGTTNNGPGDSATLNVAPSAPKLFKSFDPKYAAAGDIVAVEYTLIHSANAAADATDVAFSDNYDSVLSGLSIFSVADNSCGGSISGTTQLNASAITLAPGESCAFTINLLVPAGAAAGAYPGPTSAVSATVSGSAVTSPAVSDTLTVAGLKLTKTFIPDTIYVGDTSAVLHFNIANAATSPAATAIGFSDSLTSALTSMSATGPLPTVPCNGSSALSGTTTLTLSNGELLPGASCAFDVNLTIPSSAAVGDYMNATSALTATVNATTITSENAGAVLHIVEPLSMFKEFNQSVAMPGDTVSMTITLSNAHPTNPITSVSFSDDLDAALSGLTLTSVTSNSCGTLSGTGSGLMSLTNGTVPADGNCSIEVVLAIPASVSLDNVINNTTSNATGLNTATTVTAYAASATLYINNIEFGKSFDGPVIPGGNVVLSFHIKNLESSDINGLAFSDDLNAILSGLQSTGVSLTDICGAGSSLSGTSTLLFTGGSLAAGASCDFNVTLAVPVSATSGSYTNTTSDLTSYGSVVSKPAAADLEVALIPGFSKVFAPNLIASNAISTLTFDINNSSNAFATTALAFTDNLPSGMMVAAVPNITNTCSGSVTAVAQSSQISLTGGSVSAYGSCSISINVTAAASGTYNNSSGALQTQYGNGQSASASLTVAAAPLFSKAFAPATIIPDTTSTLTFTIDNSGASLNATSLDFTDVFPSGLQIASVPNASTTCVGGTLTAVANTTTFSYTGGSLSALATCTLQVDVTSGSEGDYNNTSGALTSSLGNSGTASANLSVIAHQEIDILGNATSIVSGDTSPSTSDATDFGDVDINGGGSTHTFTIANLGAADLLLNGSPLVAISGDAAFTVAAQPASSTITAQSQTTFQVAFNPSTVGTFAAQLSIASNDADENPYTFSLSGVGYGDSDGVDEPAGVDGNHDGIEDRNQVNITTLTSGSAQITLASPSASNPLNNVSIPQNSAMSVELNDGRQILLPYGTISFTLTGLTPGATTSVSIYYPLDLELVGYAKEVGGIWYDMNATVEHNSSGNYSVVTFALTDGDMFDLDGSGSNGEIQDPGGAYRDATIAVPVAPWALTLLALLYGLAVRRRFV